jgi:hypothetical protein
MKQNFIAGKNDTSGPCRVWPWKVNKKDKENNKPTKI